ncbi:subtilisin-like protease SBT4.8 [Prosopis cineraria]|uniref:subtilisin-like protease SBT4.8 n=1 Tax=Prosopis cineraria TaxID=364024 RepID=UPI00240FB684|nr:subtilisin-like protease SBT4.8 [Prosopis cineraria]
MLTSCSWHLLLSLFCSVLVIQTRCHDPKTYIVCMGEHPKGMKVTKKHHMSLVQRVLGNGRWLSSIKSASEACFTPTTRISMDLRKTHKLRATRSWDFIGFAQQVKGTSMESDITVGVIDSGIWPDCDSFKPSTTKDSIHRPGNGEDLVKTSLAIAQRVYFGQAQALQEGEYYLLILLCTKFVGHLVVNDADVLAAFDEAISDDVDILSVSLGSHTLIYRDLFQDTFAIGAFHAMKKGSPTSIAANNLGPGLSTMTSFAP